MIKKIEIDRPTLESFFTALFGKELSFVLLSGHMAVNLRTFVENPQRPGLQAPSEQVRQILDLLKQFKLNSIATLDQLVRFETEQYANHLTTHGFRFDQLSDDEIKSILIIMAGSYSSIHPSVKIIEIVKFIQARSYDEVTLGKLEEIDRNFDQKFLTAIRKHPNKEQVISRFFRVLTGELGLQPVESELDRLFNTTVSNLNHKGITARNLQKYFQFRGLIPVPTEAQS